MSIATVLCREMDRAGITQKTLGAQAGISQSYISQICSGKKVPTISTLTQICSCMNLPLTLFFEDEKADEAQGPLRLTEDERRLVLLYRSLKRPGGAAGSRFPHTKKSPGRGKKRTLTRMDDEEELR